MRFIGDTHGYIREVLLTIEQRDIRDDTLIHVGDFGVGLDRTPKHTKELNEELNKWLKERNLVMHVFRGNHDDPEYFLGDHIFTNLKFQPDYTILEIDGKRLLGVGGALSIDRVIRTDRNHLELKYKTGKLHHFHGCEFKLDMDRVKEIRDIDILVTHTTPDFLPPVNIPGAWPYIVNQFMGEDPTLGDDLVNERLMLTEFYNILKKNNNITHHFYGHFHTHRVTPMEDCLHTCLYINEVYNLPDTRDYEDEMNEKYGE